jgi:pantoate--beta-alanine ligase
MYPEGFQTHVEPGELGEALEGAGRPGHFRGVTTVVTKLFGAMQPDFAVFGEKDFQQLAIIKRLVADLDMDIEIIGVPTVREVDGLAISSRNQRLSAEDRAAAVCIARAMHLAERARADGEHDPDRLLAIAALRIDAEPRARVEYLRIVDPFSLEPVADATQAAVIVAAVWFGDVRLIDNLRLSP